MKFGDAIEALKQGKRIRKFSWTDKGMFVFMQVPSVIGKEIVPKMQSLPQSVKDEFQRRFNATKQMTGICYSNQLAIVYDGNNIEGWAPSPSDVLDIDWIILD